jgi:hypothetical protein
VKIPGSEPQLVVYSFISPQDTIIKVYVEWSTPYSQDPREDNPMGGNADVQLARKGENFVQLSYDEELRAFTILAADFPVEAGNEYVLKVESHTGESVEAECFVPAFEVAEVVVGQPEFFNDQYDNRMLRYDWSVTAPDDGKERFFRSASSASICLYYDPEINPDTPFCDNYQIWLDRGKEFFQDESGDTYAFRAVFWGSIDLDGSNPVDPNNPYEPQRIDSIFVYVLQTDYHYYRFHQSVENYYYYDDDFPFSESVHIYSNIKGGLGTFGGCNKMRYLVAATFQEE